MLIVALRDFALTNSRLPLIARLQDLGWSVDAAVRAEGREGELRARGVRVHDVPFRRVGVSVDDGRAMVALMRICRELRPTLIHTFNAKPMLLGSAAAGTTGFGKIVASVTGLGNAFVQPGMARVAATWGYAAVTKHIDAVIFENVDDRAYFLGKGWVRPERAHLVVGTGVDTERFHPADEPKPTGDVRVIMISRLLRQKGVVEYVDAAVRLRERHPDVTFVLGGELDVGHPDAVGVGYIKAAAEGGAIDFIGFVRDVPAELRASDIFVFPSYYREGVPRVLMEASACGLPIITADAPGCREAIRDGETGLMVRPRDVGDLVAALERLIPDADLRRSMGAAGRTRAVAEFDVDHITDLQLAVYREIGAIPA